ncbi:hypothetical protein BGX38DRAFT_1265349 [Terfezia claveryi]|nr:hypothetical protein BGX38DRAFT_1265349 [Terfezia claveryi]
MGDEQPQLKKRKPKWATSYSKIPIKAMLEHAEGVNLDATKEEVYKEIKRFLRIAEEDPDIKEASINHLVYGVVSPVLEYYIDTTGRETVQLRSEKELLSTDDDPGREEEHVVVDLIELKREEYILIVEAKRSSVGTIYGFVTTGKCWRMIIYDGESFQKSEEMVVLFDAMGSDRQRWMDSYSVVVECNYFALGHGEVDTWFMYMLGFDCFMDV